MRPRIVVGLQRHCSAPVTITVYRFVTEDFKHAGVVHLSNVVQVSAASTDSESAITGC
jgi:hypothetical protein